MPKDTNPAAEAARARGARTRDAVLAFVAAFCAEHHYGPSYAEIAAAVGIHWGSVPYPVNLLIAEGRLVREAGIARSLRVVEGAPTGVGATTPHANDRAGSVGAVEMHCRESP
jgi:hypothetical protein